MAYIGYTKQQNSDQNAVAFACTEVCDYTISSPSIFAPSLFHSLILFIHVKMQWCP